MGIAVAPPRVSIPWLICLDQGSRMPTAAEIELLISYSRYLLKRRALNMELPARMPTFRTIVFCKGADSSAPRPEVGWNWKLNEWRAYDSEPMRWDNPDWKPWSLRRVLDYIEGQRFYRLVDWVAWVDSTLRIL